MANVPTSKKYEKFHLNTEKLNSIHMSRMRHQEQKEKNVLCSKVMVGGQFIFHGLPRDCFANFARPTLYMMG